MFIIFQEGLGTKDALSITFDSLKNGLGSFLKSFSGQATLTIASAIGIYKAFDYLQTGWTRAGEAAEKATSEFQDANSELESLKSQKADQQSRVQEIAAKYDIDTSELQDADGELKSVDQMISVINSHGGISLVDQAELDGLSSAGSQLEAQLAIQEQITEAKKQAMIHSAEKAAGTEKTYYEQMKEEHGGFKGFFKWLQGQSHFEVDEYGNQVYKAQSDADKFYGESGDTTDLGLLKTRTSELKEYKAELKSLDEEIANSKKNGEEVSQSTLDRHKELSASIDDVSVRLADSAAAVSSDMEILSQSDSDFAVSYMKDAEDALHDFNTMDLSPKQKALKDLDFYFSGDKNTFIKDQLLDAAKSGESLEGVLGRLGLKLSDLGEGVSSDTLRQYFQDIAKSAKDAEKAVSKTNNNLTMDDIGAAFQSKNAGDDYVSFYGYMKKAKELFDQGLTGTDDFKVFAEALSYGIDSSAASFAENYENAQKFFIEDEKGNLTVEGVDNFVNALAGLDKGYASWNEEAGKWDINIENTAKAAQELEVSVQLMEALLGRIKDYDNVGNFDFHSAVEDFNTARSSLEGLRSIYDEMSDDSPKKKLLGAKLEGWEAQLGTWEENLAELDTDIVMNIRLEYDLAAIQAQIDEAQALIDFGQNTVGNNAEVLAGNEKYIDTAREGTGLNIEGITAPPEFSANEEIIELLKTQLGNASSEEETLEIQGVIEGLQELQKQLLDEFSFEHPEINADSTEDEASAAWESFLSSAGNQEKLADIAVNDEEAIEKVADILGVEPEDIVVDIKANDEASGTIDLIQGIEVMDKVVTLVGEDEASYVMTIWNALSADPKFAMLSAQDQATYVIQQWNSLTPEQKEAYMKGEISIVDDATGIVANVNHSINSIPLNPHAKITASNLTAGPAAAAAFTLNTLDGKTAHTYIITHRSETGGSSLNGSAQKDGTLGGLSPIPKLSARALAMGTLQDDSWLNPRWKTKKGEVALTGEVGQEMVVHGNRWWTVGNKGAEFSSIPAGSVVFNARQTKELLRKGFTNSRGRAHLEGTAYAGGADGSFSFSGGAAQPNSYKSYSSTLNNVSAANTVSSAASSMAQAAEDLKDFAEIYLDRASDITQKQIDAIDRAVGLADKQNENAKAVSNIQAEISKNRQAYDLYMQQADSVGLSEAYASQVRDGSLNIESISDETLSKNIKSYEEWYKKAQDCLDKVSELQDKERELAIERLEQIEDFYKLVTDVHEALQDANDSKLEFSEAMGFSAVSDSVRKTYQESLNAAEEIYHSLAQQLTDYQNEFSDLISKGYIQKYSDEWYEGYAKIHEFNEAVDSAGVSVVDFEDKIREITYTKIQQLIDSFERTMDKLDARIDLMESRDETVPEAVYQKQLDANNLHISGNKQMRDAKLSEQALYAVDSKRYQELAKEINKLDTETLGLMEDNEKLKDTIFELRFTPLEEGIDKMESLRSELKNFMNLLNDDAYFGRKGELTSEGAAALALLEQSMYSAKQEIADYRKGLDKLQESFDNNVISQAEFDEKSEEYRKGIRDSIADVQDYSEALTKLYLNQMKQENEHLQKIIDKRKEALKAKADYYDYDKRLRSQSKDVTMLKSQIAALEGVNNASAQAELKRLKEQLSNAEDELSETKRDHAIDMQEKGYHTMSDELDEILSNTEYEIIHNADKQQAVIQGMLQNVVSMYSSAYGKINEIIHNTGWVGSTGFNSNQEGLSTQEGAANQVTNATQHQTNVSSTGTAQGTVTSPIKNNDSFNQKFEQEISRDPNVDNRPVAELKLSQKSLTLEEGKSTSISAQIRPTDAKNKTLSWKSSNEKVASVSNGTIRAVKPGSCQVTASTTDGSGISASVGVTVTKKPDPPKPAVNAPSSSSGGDGIPRVGDVVTLLAGQRYYHSSWGTSPAGNRYAGVPGGVIIDGYSGVEYGGQSGNHGDYGIHIRSADGVYGDLGWVSLSQITGYSKGTRRVAKDGPALFDETAGGKSAPGSEVIITKYGTLKQFHAGDTVFNNEQVQRLYDWSNTEGLPDIVHPGIQELYTPAIVPAYNTQNVELNINKLLTIEDGVITKDTIPDVKKAIKDCIPMIQKEVTGYLYEEGRKLGMRR